jgi:beta-lactamase regulating signal transducer with metallopeptidase domain
MTFNMVIEKVNIWSELPSRVVWSIFWQSSILIFGMFLLDLFLRRRLRPSVRHALWLVVLVKLLLPPSFALPTGLAWWVRPREPAPLQSPAARYVVTYGRSDVRAPLATASRVVIPEPWVHLSNAASIVMGTCGISLALLIAMMVRWRLLRRELHKSESAPIWLQEIVTEAQRQVRHRGRVSLRLTDASISPAVIGLFRPIIVLPMTLIDRLTPSQLRAVLLHELTHLRNGDVWINCFQSLLQIVFWWHPFVWLANARVRRIREEVVDDSVRLALCDEAETYAPTLLEVARLTLARPLATLGLVGILESRHALRQRVERMVNSPAPKRTGLTLGSIFGILAFTCVAVPMGQAPPKKAKPIVSNEPVNRTLAQLTSVSDLSQTKSDISELSTDSDHLNSKASLSNSKTAPTDNEVRSTVVGASWELRPLTENGFVEYDLRTRSLIGTNGVMLKQADTAISADSINWNGETGEIVAQGSVKMRAAGADLPMGGKLSINETNLQRLAQNQPAVINPVRGQIPVSGRRRVLAKLEAIRLNHVVFDNLPLNEVVNYLRDESKKRDPEGKGINFLLMPYSAEPTPGTIDPATGLQVPTPQSEAPDINAVSIRIVPSLDDIRMVDVLDAIIKVADRRIRYSIEDYGISFRLAGNETPTALFSRSFKVDPNTFAQGLESVVGVSVGNFQTGGQGGGGQQGNSSVTVPRVQVAPNGTGGQGGQGSAQGGGGGISGVTRPTTMITPQSINQFLSNAGVKLSPPKSAFYNDRAGTLLVHASLNELDAVESALGTTSFKSAQLPPAAHSGANETKQPPLGDLPKVGGTSSRTAEVVVASSPAGSNENAKNTDRIAKQVQHLSSAPPQINIKARFVEIAKGKTQKALSDLGWPERTTPNSDGDTNACLSQVLTEPEFRVILHALEQRDGTDVLTTASVTTLSSRQAQIQAVDLQTILRVNPQALTPPGVSSTNLFITENSRLGPVLDVVPVVADDGLTISLNTTATITQFLGYGESTDSEQVQVYVDGKAQSTKPPLPRFRVRQLHTVSKFADGETLMLGKPTDVVMSYDKDGNAVTEPGNEPKDLLVFLTTTLIDPAGNPIHRPSAPEIAPR